MAANENRAHTDNARTSATRFGLLFIGSSFWEIGMPGFPLKPTRPASNTQIAAALPNGLRRVTRMRRVMTVRYLWQLPKTDALSEPYCRRCGTLCPLGAAQFRA